MKNKYSICAMVAIACLVSFFGGRMTKKTINQSEFDKLVNDYNRVYANATELAAIVEKERELNKESGYAWDMAMYTLTKSNLNVGEVTKYFKEYKEKYKIGRPGFYEKIEPVNPSR